MIINSYINVVPDFSILGSNRKKKLSKFSRVSLCCRHTKILPNICVQGELFLEFNFSVLK